MVAASTIIIFVTYLAAGLSPSKEKKAPKCLQVFAGFLVIAVLLQIYLGALVAGLHAGLSYNTWPLIDGKIIPNGLLTLSPFWHNFFENTLTVQFVHRMWAYSVLILVLVHYLLIKRSAPKTAHLARARIFFLMVILQAVFGIVTLLMHVPIFWGALHQFFALIILVFSAAHWRAMKGVDFQ